MDHQGLTVVPAQTLVPAQVAGCIEEIKDPPLSFILIPPVGNYLSAN
jgi:hypothetical protein